MRFNYEWSIRHKRDTHSGLHVSSRMLHSKQTGQRNFAMIACCKQAKWFIYSSFSAHDKSKVITATWPSVSNPFSIFYLIFFSFPIFSIFSPSHKHPFPLSHFTFPLFPSSLPNLFSLLLFMLLEFHRWSDLRRWQLCKTQFKWMQDSQQWKWHKRHTHKPTSNSFMPWKFSCGGRDEHLGIHYYKSTKIIYLYLIYFMLFNYLLRLGQEHRINMHKPTFKI